ncbi:MAG: Fic family protein [Verrucomicrobia bacterium]|nr:Fic family protein [Verrucomicrobiota bacterium]MCH8528073.1 Fic family protein [Kiritimatiellia bacterium]
MKRTIQGKYETATTLGEAVRAFVPSPLPPVPPIDWHPQLRSRFDGAMHALGRLDSVSSLLPDVSLFLYTYVRKEAVLSSMIEGTQSSLSDLLLYEMKESPGVPLDDVREVSNYVNALEHGLRRLRGGFPLSLRLIREMHELLLADGRGREKDPGAFRRSQNWIGGTRPGNAHFVPPPPQRIMECMGALELFLHNQPEPTPPLIKAALAHVQFETIHPFLDGNGRLGRLLIPLILCESGILREPMLYLSLFFKTHRQTYYDLLNRVRTEGDWEAWLDYFAEAVTLTATQAVDAVQRLEALARGDRERIHSLGRAAKSARQIHQELLRRPLATSPELAHRTGLTAITVNRALDHLCTLEILREITGQRRNRVFAYPRFLAILQEGTEPLVAGS